MPRINYTGWTPRTAAQREVVSNVDTICRDMQGRGYSLTLRDEHIEETVDRPLWEARRATEREESEDLRTAEARWADVVAYLRFGE